MEVKPHGETTQHGEETMKILVATRETQGRRASDFCFVDEGEPVTFAGECDTDRDDIDGGCGCRRAMTGLQGRTGTTTFKVAEKDMDSSQFFELLCESYIKAGYGSRESVETYAKDDFEEIQQIVGNFREGAVLEKRGDIVQARA